MQVSYGHYFRAQPYVLRTCGTQCKGKSEVRIAAHSYVKMTVTALPVTDRYRCIEPVRRRLQPDLYGTSIEVHFPKAIRATQCFHFICRFSRDCATFQRLHVTRTGNFSNRTSKCSEAKWKPRPIEQTPFAEEVTRRHLRACQEVTETALSMLVY